ncbi:CLUMA_CG001495, isoform A [Clunio marinus]|uniref:CLUMA_CG001495, isoform A n=1 Tax=Clunio marinus TaxID=568069 RepID=A0A1J1HN92_9DIPT|nr:CLUMA_CG001495, isoform A [Clunio marinus]
MISIAFKLKNAKILFAIGLFVSLVIGGCALVKERTNSQISFYKSSSRIIADNLVNFLAITVVLTINLYYSAKLLEGIVHRLPFKILPWVLINGVNLIQLSVHFFTIDTIIGYLTLVVFSYIWLTMLFLFYEILKATKEENTVCNQPASAPTVETIEIPYNTFGNDKRED